MKYVSPKTEQRKKKQQKRKKQLLVCACFAVLIIVLTAAVVVLTGKDKTLSDKETSGTHISSETIDSESESIAAESEPESETVSSDTENSNSTDSKTDSQSQTISESSKKPDKQKQSLFKKIASIFSKKEEKVYFPAMSFGVQIQEAADSIISLSPFATEVILSSPSQHSLIAVSEYCNKRGNDLMTAGTPLIPKTDKIIQLAPDYLIVQNPLGEQDRIKIEQSGITILQVKAPKTLEDLQEVYRSITALTQGASNATQYGEKIYADLAGKLSLYETALAQTQKKSAVMLFNSFGMVATEDTLEGNILSTFFEIAVDGQDYYAGDTASVAATNPQVLIVPDTVTDEQLVSLGFGETPAYIDGNVYYVNMQDFENISAKSVKTLAGIANSVYGNVIKPAPTPSPETK